MGLDSTFRSDPQPRAKGGPPRTHYQSQPWYDAYMAALFEADRRRIEERIRAAKQLILARERQLLAARGDATEQDALNNALHALRALHMCLK